MNYSILETELVSDLLQLHKAVIYKYRQALLHPRNLAGDLKSTFVRIVEECMKCRDQLLHLVEETKEMVYYQQPEDMLALVIATGERKAILAYSATDIREVLDIYSEALSHDGIGEAWKDICLDQYTGMIKLYAHIRQLHDAQ